jgi:hypothetical protein
MEALIVIVVFVVLAIGLALCDWRILGKVISYLETRRGKKFNSCFVRY